MFFGRDYYFITINIIYIKYFFVFSKVTFFDNNLGICAAIIYFAL